MIGFLRGRLVVKKPPSLTVDVNGVGYELEAPLSTFYDLPAVGSEVTLVTHLVVREDAHILFGFATEAERRLFRGLLKVSGVGPRLGLAILSGISIEGFLHCLETQDVASLIRIPGVGRKTAERVLIEMRDRASQLATPSEFAPQPGANAAQAEAFSALVALGYKPVEVSRMLKAVEGSDGTTEDLIRRALQTTTKERS
jgi:Holliday junction DNA helicase RuvA